MKNIIDEKGRLFGKISLIDIFVVLAVLVFAAGFVYNRTSQDIRRIIMPDTPMYVTFLVEGVREFSLDAVQEGDIFFRQHERVPLGTVSHITTGPTYDIIVRQDGTAALVPVEDRFNMYITLDAIGSITDTGYFVNGTQQMAAGGRISLQSNRLLVVAMIYEVGAR